MAPKKRCSKKKKKIEEVILVKQKNNLTMKRRERQKRPWSDLPADLLMDILARNYCSADQIRSRAVCKSWQRLPIDHENTESAIHEINKLPWVVVTGDRTNNDEEEESCSVLTCKLFDPKHPNPYSVNKILFKDRRSNLRPGICSSKHGWLLFEKKKHINLTSFFLFSPFTQQFIHLPDLDNFIPGLKYTSPPAALSYATFSSSDPYNDPDCEFFVLRDFCIPNWNRIAISTCHRGDQNWTTRVFDKENQVFSIGPIRQVLYTAEVGYLCCFSDSGSLIAYSVARKDWIRLINPQMQVISFEGRPHLIECEGGFLLVLVRNGHHYDEGCRIFKFSWSSNNWDIESSLPNQAIFVGLTSLLVPASGEIANKIYYHDLASKKLKFYCLEERKSRRYRRAAAAADDDSLYKGWLAKRMLQKVLWIQSRIPHNYIPNEAF